MINYYEKPEEYKFVKDFVDKGKPLYCTGPAGCGKSEMFRQIAHDLKRTIYELSGHNDIRPDDFLGYKTAQAKEIKWIDGLLPRAAREGAMLVVNEISSVSPGILFALHFVLEENGRIVLTEHQDKNDKIEEVKPKDGFCLICTDNTAGIGDSDGMYAGTQVMNQAFLDRFQAVVKMGYLKEAQEIKVLNGKFGNDIDDEDAKTLVQIANMIRTSNSKGETSILFSTRRLVNMVENMIMLGKQGMQGKKAFRTALELSILNRIEDADRGTVVEIVQRVMGVDLKK